MTLKVTKNQYVSYPNESWTFCTNSFTTQFTDTLQRVIVS